ncbi:MAG: hypothetical protein ROW48_10510 [Bellilinea sp.]|jgi:hypothetical protein
MSKLETNIFPITNLCDLTSEYKLFEIKGLIKAQNEYYQNRQLIIEKLSYQLKNPVTVIERNGDPYLVVLNDGKEPPQHLALVRTTVTFVQLPGIHKLDYSIRSDENDTICLRFLDFLIQAPLYSNKELWQPGAGQPFFTKSPDDKNTLGSFQKYSGFAVRATITPNGGLGFCIDVASKIINKTPLPSNLTQDGFAKWKNKHAIYHYGYNWYDIQMVGLGDQDVSSYPITVNGKTVSLIEFVAQDCQKPIPLELAQVKHDSSVVLYMNNRGEPRAAISSLCYPVITSVDNFAGNQHKNSIMPPHIRRSLIHDFVKCHLRGIKFGNVILKLSDKPVSIEQQLFVMPDFLFGNSTVLSVRGSHGTKHVSLDDLGNRRMAFLRDPQVGVFNKDPLDRQYLILPQSVEDSFGQRFCKDLQETFKQLFPDLYDPIVVTYNDRVPKTFARQGNAILQAVQTNCQKPGYAIVMIHHNDDRQEREEDQLAAMVIAELRKRFDITASVIHSQVGQESYRLSQNNGNPQYLQKEEKRGLLSGYLRMVVLNKILLTNQRWPFVLETRLNADITIGVDVKQHTVGFVSIGKNGADIRALPPKVSRQKEKLDARQMKAYLVEIIRLEASLSKDPINTIVLQRDGRIFHTEIIGLQEAMELLKIEGTIPQTATLTILEIAKTSQTRFRLFDTSIREEKLWIDNPQIGSYCIINENDGYLCTTGRAFRRNGTVKPLYVKKVLGPLPIEQILEDVFYLSALAWTRPNDCSRYPITTKLNDRFLGEEATNYAADELDIAAILEEENI